MGDLRPWTPALGAGATSCWSLTVSRSVGVRFHPLVRGPSLMMYLDIKILSVR